MQRDQVLTSNISCPFLTNRRKALKQNNSKWQEKGSKQKGKKTELSLAIHVDDFRTELEQT